MYPYIFCPFVFCPWNLCCLQFFLLYNTIISLIQWIQTRSERRSNLVEITIHVEITQHVQRWIVVSDVTANLDSRELTTNVKVRVESFELGTDVSRLIMLKDTGVCLGQKLLWADNILRVEYLMKERPLPILCIGKYPQISQTLRFCWATPPSPKLGKSCTKGSTFHGVFQKTRYSSFG